MAVRSTSTSAILRGLPEGAGGRVSRLAAFGLLVSVVLGQAASVSRASQDDDRPRIGLVLSGGGARGAAHVGVLQVLEDLNVPVDVVVGTSMGSIVGGLYASGYSPDEMAEILTTADWAAIFSDAPPRDELWFRRRQDDRRFQIDLELGWVDGAPALPPGLILGLNVEAFLAELMPATEVPADFDDLRLPFRCVATDLADGGAVVLERGSLPQAIRASMSLPGVFAPITIDGRTLVDGGVVDNVPVEAARMLGADVVIVVDISTPLAELDQPLQSLFAVSNQVIGIMMSENRRRSMESLSASDLAIVPELGDIGVMAFDRSVEAMGIGRRAADGVRTRLAELAVDRATWLEWLAAQRRRPPVPATVGAVRVDGDTNLSDEVIRAVGGLERGDELDAAALSDARRRLAGLGIFERIEIDVAATDESPEELDVTLRPTEKRWGPHYLRFRLGGSSDLEGSGDFDIGVQHTWTPLNSMGGEWRNEVEVGTRTRLFTEFYQPLDRQLRWFVAPFLEYEQDNLPLIVNQDKVAEVSVDALEGGLALGRNLGSWGEARVQYGWLAGSARPEIALPGLIPEVDVERGQVATILTADTLDDISFPRTGFLARASWEFSDESLGGDQHLSVVQAKVGVPISSGPLTLLPSFEAGSTLEGDDGLSGTFFLGGFQRLSGIGVRELSGKHYALGVAQAYYQLSERTTLLGFATYVGASIELGGVWQDRDDVSGDELILAGSVFAALDSLLGPIYVAFGAAEGGEHAAYVFIEPVF